ncbi:MAG: hypothetical protein Q7U51_08105 [Methanoregula sp.]|nr:hypothetical protein [Methanoregula sp.]
MDLFGWTITEARDGLDGQVEPVAVSGVLRATPLSGAGFPDDREDGSRNN